MHEDDEEWLHYYGPKENERLEHTQNSSLIHHQTPLFPKTIEKGKLEI